MKKRLLVFFTATLCIAMLAASVTLFANAFNPVLTEADGNQQENAKISAIGTYYSSKDGSEIKILDDETIVVDGIKAMKYEMKTWKDIPKTEEATGKITFTDYYYINADGVRYSFDPISKTLTLKNKVYMLSE